MNKFCARTRPHSADGKCFGQGSYAPIAQWIEHWSSEPVMGVQFSLGAQIDKRKRPRQIFLSEALLLLFLSGEGRDALVKEHSGNDQRNRKVETPPDGIVRDREDDRIHHHQQR